MSNEVYWKPNFVTPDWAGGSREVRHWELVVPTRYGVDSFGERYTGVLVFPDGRILVGDNVYIQCASVEEAKEIGIITYLLTQEGGGSTP